MEKNNFDYAVANALRVRSSRFDLEAVLQEYHEHTTWFSHFLCEANRHSPLGLGGDAFRCWYAGIYRSGAYLFSDTYHPGLVFASNPEAKVSRGCCDSRCHGDPCPRLSNGARWVSVFAAVVPDDLRNRIIAQATTMAREAAEAMLRIAWRFKAENEREAAERGRQHAAMLERWAVVS